MPNAEKRTLRRSQNDRIIAGICGGIGEFFGLNPWWFRIGFIIASIPGGIPGIVMYTLAWVIIPKT